MKNLIIAFMIPLIFTGCATEPMVMDWNDGADQWVIDGKSDSMHSISVWGNDSNSIRFRAEGPVHIQMRQTSAFQRPPIMLVLVYGGSQFRSSLRESPSILFDPGSSASGLQDYELTVVNSNSDSVDGELSVGNGSGKSFCNDPSRHSTATPYQYVAMCEKVLDASFDDNPKSPVTSAKACIGRGYNSQDRRYSYGLFGMLERDLGGFEGKTQSTLQVSVNQGDRGQNFGLETDTGIQINNETGTVDHFSDEAMTRNHVDYDRESSSMIYRFSKKEQGAFTEWELEASTLLGCKDL
ncbi:MAG TPA: hypothetical protein EYN66_15900 [Myxococcales bacterium]|nr:hypothetical protein [Myxococcales bacterium]